MDHCGSHRGSKDQHAEDLHAEPLAGVGLKLVRRPFRNGQLPLWHPVAWQRHHMSPGRLPLGTGSPKIAAASMARAAAACARSV